MNQLRLNPFARVLFPLIIGISIGFGDLISIETTVSILGPLLLVFIGLFFYLFKSNSVLVRFCFGALLAFVFIGFGVVNYQITSSKVYDSKLHVESFENVGESTILVIKKQPIKMKNTWVAEAELVHSNIDYSIYGKAYFKDSILLPQSGQIIRTNRQIQSLQPPSNPGQFDFAKYYHNNNLFFTIYISDFDVIGRDDRTSFLDVFKGIQYSCLSIFKKYLKGKELAIASALVLGEKSYLTPDIKKAYSEAGAMHVLAVSGLHVGLVYLLLSYLFKGLGKSRNALVLKTLIIVVLILFYAGATGFSPSVTRASIMFSLIAVGGIIRRNSSIYNIIFTSAFGMLLWDPLLLFNVSFQLSYIAVIGIIYLYPKIFNLFFPKTAIGYYLWSLICLSLSAQIATFPLALYYFGLFPTWFLLTNLIVVPAAMIELGGGFALLVSSYFGVGSQVGFFYSHFIHLVNSAIDAINSIPPGAFLASLSAFQMVLVYGLVIMIVWWLSTINRLALSCLVILLVSLQVAFIAKDHEIANQSGVIIYDDRLPVMELYSGRTSIVYADSTNSDFQRFEKYILTPSLKQRSIERWSVRPLENLRSVRVKVPNSKDIHWLLSKNAIDSFNQFDSSVVVMSHLRPYKKGAVLNNLADIHGIDIWDCKTQGYFFRTLE